MARLPRREDLGPLPDVRPRGPIATANASAVGRGMRQFGAGLAKLGADLSAAAAQGTAADRHDAEMRFQEFKWGKQREIRTQMNAMEPGQANGFAERAASGYQEAAKEFLGTVPEPLKPVYDRKLFSAERNIVGAATEFAEREQKRSALVQTTDAADAYKTHAHDGSDVEEIGRDYKELLAANPYLTPIDRDKLWRKTSKDFEEAHVLGRLQRGEDYNAIIQDIKGKESSPKKDVEQEQQSAASVAPNAAAYAMITSRLETGQADPLEGVASIARDAGYSRSYGNFGLNSRRGGSIYDFVAQYGKGLGLKGKPGTPEFDRSWREAAKRSPQELHAAEMAWYSQNVTSKVIGRLEQTGVPGDLAKDPRVVAYFADRSIQQGPGSIADMAKHKRRIKTALGAADGDVEAFLQNLTEADRGALRQDFPTALRTGVYSAKGHNTRLNERLRMALGVGGEGGPPRGPSAAYDGIYPNLDSDQRARLLNKARVEQRQQAIAALDNGMESLRRTGEAPIDDGGNDALANAKGVLPPAQFLKYRQRWVEAGLEHHALNGLSTMPGVELQQHIHDLSSASPEDPQFAAHMAIAEKAAKQADQIRTLRARDPAKAVAPFPEVAEAEAKWLESPDDPETVQDLVRARIAAQQKIGLSDAEISPITREEARQAIAPALGLKGPALVEQLTSLSGQLEEKYGEYAPAVARSAIRTAVRSAEEAEIIQGVLSRAWRGKPVLAAQVRQLEELAEATDAERALMPMAYTGEPFRQMGVPTETTRFPRKSAMPPAGDAFTQFAGKPFSVETIEQARRLPPGTQFYDPNGVLRTR